MSVKPATWVTRVDPAWVDERFGVETVSAALAAARLYASPPMLDAAGRVAATLVPSPASGASETGPRHSRPGGGRLSTPMKLTVRVRDDDVIDVSCACRHGRVCDHVIALLVDIAFDDALRAAVAAGELTEELVQALPASRAAALEHRTLDERLAAWLPPRRFDEDWEIDVDAVTITNAAAADGRAALLLRHRRAATRAMVAARDVLAARLRPRHRRLVELTAPYHLDKNVLVATRGQAAILAHLLREEIGLFADHFKARVRYGNAPASPRVERDGDRLVARWYAADGALLGDAGTTFLLAGPYPYLWSPATRTFHPVSLDVDLDAALGMARVPSLPLGGATEQVGRALLLRGRGLGVALPEPAVFGLPPLERPTFELYLTGTPLEVKAKLDAVYGVGKITVGAGEPDGGRDAGAEQEAVAALEAAGFVSTEHGLVAVDENAALLWQSGLATLRASETPRFAVFVAESISRTTVGAPVQMDVRVTSEVGWLDVELEFRAGSLKFEKERMHRALAHGKRWTELGDGTLAKIADEVAAFFTEVTPLYQGKDAIHLPPHQFGRIARWIELADQPDARLRVDIDPRAKELRTRLRALAKDPHPALPVDLRATLRPYQLGGLAWLQFLKELGAGGVLADDMGLGKTLMTLAFLSRWREDDGPGPCFVVCPTSVVGNWIREAARFTPSLSAIAWTGTARKDVRLEEYDLVVTTYGVLRRDIDKLAKQPFRCVVLDEAQNIKNPAAITARAARRLDARMRLALSGTPIENRLSELWSLMTLANPGMLGTAADFDERYERPIDQRRDGAVAAELRAVVRPFVLRRTKKEVLLDLPPKTEIDRSCVFGLRQRRAYDALALAVREAVGKRERRRANAQTQLSVLTAILRLRQLSCDPRLVDPEARPEDSAKRASFLDLVRELVSEDRRALVFSQFVELLTLWREDLDRAKVAYEYLDGSTRDRDAVVDRFQKGNAPLFLVSLKAGGAGLNLTAADTVIHCDPWWNPAVEDQATDRAHRIGQSRSVTVIRLVAQGTIEDKIALLKQKKVELADAVLSANAESLDERVLATLSDDDVDFLLGDAEGEVDADADA